MNDTDKLKANIVAAERAIEAILQQFKKDTGFLPELIHHGEVNMITAGVQERVQIKLKLRG